MKDFECPVYAQRAGGARELVDGIDSEANDEIRMLRGLSPTDKYTEMQCDVGNCAVRGFVELRVTHGLTSATFATSNPSLCKRNEHPIETQVSVTY